MSYSSYNKPDEQGSILLSEGGQIYRIGESGNFTGPFASLTWEDWQAMQAEITTCLTRFESAAQEKRGDRILMIGLEIQELVSKIFLEAYVLSAHLPLVDLREF